MAHANVYIKEFIELAGQHAVLDVRSPAEYKHAHIPGAYSLPLFNDEERKIVGTLYKQQGKQAAVKQGLDFFGPRMKKLVEETEKIVKEATHKKAISTQDQTQNTPNTLLVHCWRGGLRSAGMAWLLDLYGFKVYTLTGGYKAYRQYVLNLFEKDYNLNIIGGYTGSGKTALLTHLKEKGHCIVDLENLANHRGSAFGDIGTQPTQEMFENLLAENLDKNIETGSTVCWVEDESQRIGQLNIPNTFWKTMRSKTVYFLDIPFERRLELLLASYGTHDKEKLINSIIRIQKRLGPLETKTAIGCLIENNYKACFEILLCYYDKLYNKSLLKREDAESLLKKVFSGSIDPVLNTQKILYALS